MLRIIVGRFGSETEIWSAQYAAAVFSDSVYLACSSTPAAPSIGVLALVPASRERERTVFIVYL